MNRHRHLPVALLLLLAGCGGRQSILDPANPAAANVETFWWFAFSSTGVLSLLVIGGLLWGIRRAARASGPEADEPTRRKEERFILIAGALVPTLFLAGFLSVSVRTGSAGFHPPSEPALTIEVTGHMFWWEVRYPEEGIVTANEIRIPAERPIRVDVTSADVIHSFWVPKISPGKIDMVPGRTNMIWMLAEEPGEYRGQCTEFCGTQHALMSLLVIATPEEEFEAWVRSRRDPPSPPDDPEANRGMRIFFDEGCAACHAIEGVSRPRLAGSPGPDLTDLADRRTLGALTIPNDREHLTAWIENPHQFKPGVRMPSLRVVPEDLEALVSYLETLR